MTNRARRTITVADLRILVGTAAVGMGCLLAVDRTLLGNSLTRVRVLNRLGAPWNPAAWLADMEDVLAYIMPLLGGWAAVLPLLRLRDHRPSLRRSLRQPGIVACLAAWAGASWGGLAMVVAFGLWQTRPGASGTMAGFWRWAREFLAGQMIGMAGPAVAAAWLGVALAGRWRRPEDWIDRLGRILGWGWIGAGFVWALVDYQPLM